MLKTTRKISFARNLMTLQSGEVVMQSSRVLAIGVFDLFHIGHLRYLQFARKQGQHLSVAISPDWMVVAGKHKLPVIGEAQRREMLAGLGWIDAIDWVPSSSENTGPAAQWIAQWGIDHVIAGGEWQGSARWLRLTPALAERGIRVTFAPHTPDISSSLIAAKCRLLGAVTSPELTT